MVIFHSYVNVYQRVISFYSLWGPGIEFGGQERTCWSRSIDKMMMVNDDYDLIDWFKLIWFDWLIELIWIDLIDWLIDLLFDWLVGWLIWFDLIWLIGWLVDWLVGWLIDWVTDLIDLFCLIDWLIYCLIGWLIDWLTDWLIMMMMMMMMMMIVVLVVVVGGVGGVVVGGGDVWIVRCIWANKASKTATAEPGPTHCDALQPRGVFTLLCFFCARQSLRGQMSHVSKGGWKRKPPLGRALGEWVVKTCQDHPKRVGLWHWFYHIYSLFLINVAMEITIL